MKLIRIILSVAALFILVCVIAVSALIIFINPNKLKPVIAAELKKQTGYEATIEGDFSWSFYPRIGVKVERVALFVPNQSIPFVDLHDVTFVTELAQLLQGNQKLRGDIYISEMKLLNMQAKNAHVGLRWQDQALNLNPITATLYAGKLEGDARGSELSAIPHWAWDVKVSNVQLDPLLQDVNGKESKLKMSGIGQVELHAYTQGKTRDEILNNLNGTGGFDLEGGVVDGVDLNYLVQSADAIINKKPLVMQDNISQTAFDRLHGTTVIKNGVIATSDLMLVSPSFMTSGAGSINLILQAINLQLRITPQKQANTQWVIPVMVVGDLHKPDVRLDITELNIMIAKEKLDSVKTKMHDAIKAHLPGKASKFLQGLIKK
jgi:uncharacterized protein involved in outer membrane biogenesis